MSEERHSQLEDAIGNSTETLVAEAVWACDYEDVPATLENVEGRMMELHKDDVLFTLDQAKRYIAQAVDADEVSVDPTDIADPLGEWTFSIQPETAGRIARRYWFWQLDKKTQLLESDGIPGEEVVVRAAVLAYQNENDLPPTWEDMITTLGTFGYSEDRAHKLICDANQYGLINKIMWEPDEEVAAMLAELFPRWRYVTTGPIL